MKDKGYRVSFVGGEVGRFMRSLLWADKTLNTLDTYEIVLSRLSLDFAHFTTLEECTTEVVRDFLDENWGEAAPATRRNRLSIVKSFFKFCVLERGLSRNPADRITPPKRRSVEREAYSPDIIESLRAAQPELREQIAIQLLGRLALRKNELRLLKIKDIDLTKGTVLIHGKGGKVVVMPLVFDDLKEDLHLEFSPATGTSICSIRVNEKPTRWTPQAYTAGSSEHSHSRDRPSRSSSTSSGTLRPTTSGGTPATSWMRSNFSGMHRLRRRRRICTRPATTSQPQLGVFPPSRERARNEVVRSPLLESRTSKRLTPSTHSNRCYVK